MDKLIPFVVVGLLFSFFILSPLSIGTVTSESMSPTIEEGEIFFFIESSGVEQNDIIIFSTEEREQLLTHRIVDNTEEGYITKGDNNPSTDQSGSIEPVKKEQILGKLPTFMQQPLIIPFIDRSYILTLEKNFNLFITFFIILISSSILRDAFKKEKTIKDKELTYLKAYTYVFIFLTLLLILLVVLPGYISQDIVINQKDVDNNKVLEQKYNINSFTKTYLTVKTIRTSENIKSYSFDRDKNKINIKHGPYNKIGPKNIRIELYSYPKTLPKDLIISMHNINPLIPAVFTTVPYLFIVYLISIILIPSKLKIKQLGHIKR